MVLSMSLLVQVNMAAGLEGHRHSDFRFHRPTESGAAVASDTRTEDTAAACEVVKSESRYALLLLTDRGLGSGQRRRAQMGAEVRATMTIIYHIR